MIFNIIDGGYETVPKEGDSIWELCYAVLKSKRYQNAVLLCLAEGGESFSDSPLPGTKKVPRIDKLYRKVQQKPFIIVATLAYNTDIKLRMGFNIEKLAL